MSNKAPFPGLAVEKPEGGSFCQYCFQSASAGEELVHKAGCDAYLPALAEEREREAIEKAHAVFNAARDLVSAGMLVAAGYRLLIKPIDSIKGLEASQAEEFPLLAEREFEAKSESQKQREERGEEHGVVINMGQVAFNRLGGRENWCDVGDVVVFARYEGKEVEHPPGSGTMYRIMNDEDIYARVV